LPSELDKQDNYLIDVFLEIIAMEIEAEAKQLNKIKNRYG